MKVCIISVVTRGSTAIMQQNVHKKLHETQRQTRHHVLPRQPAPLPLAGNNITVETMEPQQDCGPWMIARRGRQRSHTQNMVSGAQPQAASRPPENANRFLLLESARNDRTSAVLSGTPFSSSHVSKALELPSVPKTSVNSGNT